jgi:hypothetical protein
MGPDWVKPIETPESPGGLVVSYDLQAYVPTPRAGAVPVKNIAIRRDMDVAVVWKNSSGDVIPDLAEFIQGTMYQADISLSVKNDYVFNRSEWFRYPDGTVNTQPEADYSPTVRHLTTVKYAETKEAKPIDAVNPALKIPAPAAGQTPVWFFAGEGYTGTVEWMIGGFSIPMPGNQFGPETDYNAVVTLYAMPGFVFKEEELPTGEILVNGGTRINGGVSITGIMLDFPKTGRTVVTSLDLTMYIPAPVTGGTPVKTLSVPQYTGTVKWMSGGDTAGSVFEAGNFKINAAYAATVTLTAASGCTFEGMEGTFWHGGAETITVTKPFTGSSGEVRIVFPATNEVTAAAVNDFAMAFKVPAPVMGGTPVQYFSGPQYIGNVVWKRTDNTGGSLSGLFAANTAYTATVTLTAISGWTFNGAGANVFIHGGSSGITTANNTGGTITVTIKFPTTTTAVPVTDLDLAPYLSAPKTGVAPQTSIPNSASQYTGTVKWMSGSDTAGSVFETGKVYMAMVTLEAKPGYTFAAGTTFVYAEVNMPTSPVGKDGSMIMVIVVGQETAIPNPW